MYQMGCVLTLSRPSLETLHAVRLKGHGGISVVEGTQQGRGQNKARKGVTWSLLSPKMTPPRKLLEEGPAWR